MADGILRFMAEQQRYDWEIDSAGTGGWHAGEAPDPRAIKIAKTKGVDLSTLRARKFTRRDFKEFDRIYAMDQNNLKDILSLTDDESERNKVELFFEASLGKNDGVRDPWYDDALFEPVFSEVWEGCEALLKKLKDNS